MSSADPVSVFANTMMDSQFAEASYGFLGRYRLDRMIGHGAMGAVFEAFDATLDRTLAIKTLYSPVSSNDETAFDSATVDAAILKEARAAATLNHPNIVTVYDAGRAQSSTLGRELPYVAMELLDGADLRSRLSSGQRFSVRETVSLIGKLALALDHAHKAGILHRDIKPANIFITERSGPKLVDFGLAQLTSRTERQPLSQAPVTPNEIVAGSPQYMSPEAITGAKAGTTLYNEHSDVYSLGVVFYELLCGQLPYHGASMQQLQENILEGKAQSPVEVNPALPKELSSLVMKAIAKSQSQRFRSAAQMARELRRWGQGEGADAMQGAELPASRPADLLPMGGVAHHGAAHGSAMRQGSKRTLMLASLAAVLVIGGGALWWALGASSSEEKVAAASSKPSGMGPGTSNAPATPVAPAVVSTAPVAAAPTPSPATSPVIAPVPAPVSVAQQASDIDKPSVVMPQTATPALVAAAPAAKPASAAATTGRVRLAIQPWGEIEVNGKKMGVSPPLGQFNLEPGRHTVTVRNADFSPRSFTIDVETGKTVRVAHTFQ
jgi:eukaryotic-like serine/threonine-protein kinase